MLAVIDLSGHVLVPGPLSLHCFLGCCCRSCLTTSVLQPCTAACQCALGTSTCAGLRSPVLKQSLCNTARLPHAAEAAEICCREKACPSYRRTRDKLLGNEAKQHKSQLPLFALLVRLQIALLLLFCCCWRKHLGSPQGRRARTGSPSASRLSIHDRLLPRCWQSLSLLCCHAGGQMQPLEQQAWDDLSPPVLPSAKARGGLGEEVRGVGHRFSSEQLTATLRLLGHCRSSQEQLPWG